MSDDDRGGRKVIHPPGRGAPDLEVELIRPDDLVSLRIALFNARVASDERTAYLERINPDQELILVVTFPPQNIAESTVAETGLRPRPGAVAARLAGPTRLVLQLAKGAQMPRIPFTTAGLLDWSAFEQVVSPLADIPPRPTPKQVAAAPDIEPPGPLETAIELPYRLILSPDHTATWLHAREPVAHAGRVELWHTQLARKTERGVVEPSQEDPAYLRAIWSPDYPGPAASPLGITDIMPGQRRQIVILTSAFRGWINPDGTPFPPTPIAASFLMLSPLGGWLRSRGSWNPPVSTTRQPPLSLSEWVHVAAQGRDHYVRIVEEGYLYPFGHRAALVTVSERRFEDVATPGGSTTPVAYLVQFKYIVVREPEKVYEGQPYIHKGSEMPIKRIRLTTVTTPHIKLDPLPDVPSATSGWVVIDAPGATKQDFKFHAVTTDLAGNVAELTASLIFVDRSDLPKVSSVRKDYLAAGARRACPVPNAHVTFAPRGGADPSKDNTTLVTSALHFDTELIDAGAILYAFGGFLPILHKADVRIPAVEQLLGKDTATSIRLYGPYVKKGLDLHAGVFAEIVKEEVGGALVQDRLPVTFSAQQAGGIATPNLDISCLGREHGPLAGLPENAAKDLFAAKDFFGSFTQEAQIPTLFGTLKLTDILPSASSTGVNAPKIQLRTIDEGGGKATIVSTLDWRPELQPFPSSGLPLFQPNDRRGLTIHGELQKQVSAASITPDPGTFTLTGTLRDFHIDLLGAVKINFESFSFTSQTGRKLDVNVQLDRAKPFEFEGDLAFVNRLAELIPPGTFGDPSIDITMNPPAIHVGFAIGLPPAAVGVFSLESIKLSTGLTLPLLTGAPLFDIAFAERHHPFLLTVAMLGGGGFLHVQLDTGGVRQLEAALEFGANASINLGVASGGVHILAGIYFSLQAPSGGGAMKATLTGYFRAGGELSVLGIVSVSIELMLSFSYEDGKAAGRATVTVEVHVAFFSKSVSISMEKRFGGSAGDPTFAQLMSSPAVWDAYASAFA